MGTDSITSSCMIKHACHRCGLIDEAQFVPSGPHIKQVCNGCGAYVKFISPAAIPDVRLIKEKIWFITGANLTTIEAAKTEVSFVAGMKGIYEKLQYWKLYLRLRNH